MSLISYIFAREALGLTQQDVDNSISTALSGTVQVWKAAVATVGDLPMSGNTAGDSRVVLDIDEGRIWDDDASTWVPFVASAHSQNTDIELDSGNPNEVTATDLRSHLDSIANPHSVTYLQAGAEVSGAITTHNLAFAHADIATNSGHRTTENAINGLVKVDGAGAYSAGVANDLPVSLLGTPTYDSVQDFINNTASASIVSGAAITDAGAGAVNVAAGKGMIRTTDSEIGALVSFDFGATAGLALTDNDLNWIYVNYNAGTPQVLATVNLASINFHDEVIIGKVYRAGTTLHIAQAGMLFADYALKMAYRLWEVYGIDRGTGLVTTGTGTRNIAITEGSVYVGHNRLTFPAFDSSAAGRFSYWYNNGTWQKVATQSQIDNLQYNNYGVGLATLTVNRYGVHWVYAHNDGDVHVVYGIGDYTLAQAQGATVPANLPAEVTTTGIFIAKIIIQKSAATFNAIVIPWTATIGLSAVTDHNSLGGLQGGAASEYLHFNQNYYDQWSQMPGKVEVPKAFTAAAINTAMANFGTSGGEIFLPAGIWDISTPIVVPAQRIRIRGAGRGTRLLATARLEFDAVTGTLVEGGVITGSIGAGTATIVAIRYDTATTGVLWYNNRAGTDFINNEICATGGANVTVNGAPTDPTGCINVGTNDRITISDLSAHGGYGEGVTADKFVVGTGGTRLIVRNCSSMGFGHNDIALSGTASNYVIQNNRFEKYTVNVSISLGNTATTNVYGLISGNQVIYDSTITTQDAMTIGANTHWVSVTGNVFTYSRTAIAGSGDYANISDNLFFEVKTSISMATGADYALISGNTITTSSLKGINIQGNYATVTGNNVNSANTEGINVNGSTGTTISGNTVTSSGGSTGDIVIDTCIYCTIVGNTCIGSGTTNWAISLVASTYCTVVANTGQNHDTAGIIEDSASNNNEIRTNNMFAEATPYSLAGTAGRYFMSQRLSPEYPGSVLYYDGGSNDPGSEGWNATMEVVGNYRINYYEWSSTVATGLQDAELRIRIEIPQDFIALQANALYVDIKTEENAVTNNAIDASVQKDGSATAAVSKTGIKSTVADTWYTEQAGTALIVFTAADLAGLTFTAGSVLNLTLKLYSQSSKYARVGDICLKYKAR